MPEKLDRCVNDLVNDPDFKPKGGKSKKASAFAVCAVALKGKGTEGYIAEEQDGIFKAIKMKTGEMTEGVPSKFSATLVEGKDPSGAEWKVHFITDGESLNKNDYPIEVLHRDKGVFENVAVHAAFGPDHSMSERGVKSLVGFIKDIRPASDGLEGTLHVSDPNIREILLDFHSQGVLNEMVGLSVVVEAEWSSNGSDSRRAERLIRSDSVDLVREPAAGGRFLRVTESKDGENMPDMTEEKIKEVASEAAKEAVEEERKKVAAEAKELEEKEEEEKRAKEAKAKEGKTSPEPSDQEKALSSFLLRTTISEAKLPEAAAGRISETFKDKPFDQEKVDEAIAKEKDYLASHEKVVVEGLTEKRRIITGVTMDEKDKFLHRLDAIFDVNEQPEGFVEVEGTKYPAFKSFKQLYCEYYGVSPFDVTPQEIWSDLSKGLQGYDSADGKRVKKSYEALFQVSSLGEIAADRLHKRMIVNYDSFPQYDDWKKIAKAMDVDDYLTHRFIMTGGYTNLPVVSEGTAYPEATHFTDAEATVSLQKRGWIVPQITRELIINDKLGAIRRVPLELARAAKRTLYQEVFNILRDNSTYTLDSVALFHAGTHVNTGTTPMSIAGLSAANLAMRSQTRYGSTSDVLGEQNKLTTVVIPNEIEGVTARIANPSDNIITTLTADSDTDNDPLRWKGKLQVVVVDYYTDASEYYCVADVNQQAGIGVVFLGGNQEPELFVQANENQGEMFSMDVQNVKIRFEFNVVILDYRPFYRQT